MYQIFTDYKPSGIADTEPPAQPEFPPLPPILMASYMTVLYVVSNLPSTILSAFSFVAAAIMTLTPSVIISLAYRVFVLYVSARIIPAIRESGARSLLREPSLEDSDEAGQILGFLTWFSPSILISVYTSLLMQHFATTNGESASDGWWTIGGDHASGNVWRWINVACTMVLYAIELTLAREDETSQLTSHWKVD